MKSMDIRVSNAFTEINQLAMFYFNFKEMKEEESLLFVFAHQGWWNYRAEITFRNVFLPLGPGELSWNICCRLATREEASHLRSHHTFSEEATVYASKIPLAILEEEGSPMTWPSLPTCSNRRNRLWSRTQ